MGRRKRRWLGVVVFVVLTLAIVASSSFAARSEPAKTCPSGYTLANLSWGQECLHDGEFCKIANVEYHKYGFDCPANGRLTDYAAPPTSTATTPIATSAPETTTPTPVVPSGKATIVVLKPLGTLKPHPATGAKAVALARANSDVNELVSPYKSEVGWVAQWRGNAWWLAGVFTSPWGVRFTVGAEIVSGQVGTWINHETPPTSWIRTNVGRWHLTTLFTRFTPAVAIETVKPSIDSSLANDTVIDAAAKLIDGTEPAWFFVFYVQTSSGQKLVLSVTHGPSSLPVQEGQYASYGFGGQPMLQQTVPLALADWVRSVAKARGWTPSNLS